MVDRELDRLADRIFGPKGFGLAPSIESNQMVGDSDDVLGAAIIALERDDLAARKILLEVEDIGEVRAAPPIDRLVRITRDTDVGMIDRERRTMAYWARFVS